MTEKALHTAQAALWQPDQVNRGERRPPEEPRDIHEHFESRKPKRVRLSGTVLVERDADGALVAAGFAPHDERTEFAILLDEKGTELAEELAGRDAAVVGTMVDHGGWQTLKVKKFRGLKPKNQ